MLLMFVVFKTGQLLINCCVSRIAGLMWSVSDHRQNVSPTFICLMDAWMMKIGETFPKRAGEFNLLSDVTALREHKVYNGARRQPVCE